MGRMIAKKVRGMGWMAKTSLVLIFTLIVSTFMYGGLSTPKKAEAAITYQSAGAIAYSAAGGTSVAPSYPTPLASGDLLVLIIGMKPSTANGGSVTTPTGWIPITALTGAGGYGTTLAADTGNTNIFAYYHISDGTETGTLTVTLAQNNVSWAQIYRASNATGNWSVAGTTGSDASAGNVSILFGSDPGVTANDFILGAMVIPTDVTTPAQFSAEAFTQTGVTFGTVTEVGEPDTANGNQIGGFVVRVAATAGTSTAAPTMAATAGGTTTNVRGPAVFIRIREAAFQPPPPPTPGLPSTITSCAGCHQYSPTFADGTARDVPPGQFPGSHQPHVQRSGYACSACHVAPATETAVDFEHRDGIIQMVAAAGTYSKGLSFAQSNAAFVGGTCSTATCHANVYGTGSVTTPAWGTAAGCSACHTGTTGTITASGPNTGSHAAHSSAICTDCHNAGTTATAVPSTGHADGNIDVTSGYPANVTKHAAGTYTGTCSTATCHANVYGTGSVTTPVWGTASGCTACHSVAIAASGPNTGSHALHNVTDCSQCHQGATNSTTVPTANHADGNIDVTGGYPANVTKHAAGTYTGTCSTATCHANVYGTGTVTTPVWGPTVTTGCTGCHSGAGAIAASGPNTGAHARHNITNCSQCHQGATNSTTVPTANHGDGNIDVLAALGYPQNVAKHAVGTYTGNCTTAYCHSAGTSLTAPTYAPIAWGATATCATCHTGGTASGPTYTSGTPKANSHAVHVVSSAITCNVCHNDVTTTGTTITNAANHANSVYNIQPSSAQYTITTIGTPTTPTVCGTITCHGNGNATWGGVVQCQGCHMNTSSDVNDFALTPTAFWTNGTTSTINSTEWTSAGHGRTTAYASGNPAAGFTVANACLYCHDTTVAHKTAANPFRLKNFADATWGKNGNCQSCHAAGSAGVTVDAVLKNSTSKVDSTHYGAKHSTTASGGQFCWDCHDPHGDSNVFMVHATVARTSDATTGAPTATVATTFTTFATGTDYAKSATPFNGICNVCHTTAGHYTATAGDGHNSATRCTTCHSHSGSIPNGGFAAAGGDCVACHSSAQGTRSAVSGEFGLAWGHKKVGRGAVTPADCIVCHLEGSYAGGVVGAAISTTAFHMNGNIDLRDPDGAGETPITNNSGAAFTFTKFSISYAAGSRTSAISNSVADVLTHKFCLPCHDSNGATNPRARSTTSSTAAMPFGGIALGTGYTAANDAIGTQGLVDVKKQFALTNSSRHPVLGPRLRDFPYSTRLAAPYNNIGTARDTNTATVHTTANSVVMNCFDCHTTSALPTTRTIVSHGDAATVRGTSYVASPTLCLACHIASGTNQYGGNTQHHGTGSAWSATGSSHGTAVMAPCHNCHGSNTNTTKPARPRPAQDYHGSNALASGGLWPTVNSRPYAFIRGWSGTAYHRPYRASEFTTGSAQCGAGTCPGGGQVGDGSTRNYTPGGTY